MKVRMAQVGEGQADNKPRNPKKGLHRPCRRLSYIGAGSRWTIRPFRLRGYSATRARLRLVLCRGRVSMDYPVIPFKGLLICATENL